MPALRTLTKHVTKAVQTLKKKASKAWKSTTGAAGSSRSSPWKAATEDELKDIAKMMKDAFEWEHTPRSFQEQAVRAQLMRKDVLVHAGTGNGKTAIAAGPHAHPVAKGKVTLMVSPLIALQEEQVTTFEEEFKLTATAINSTRGGLSQEKIREIREGKYQVVIASPEMILSKVFITQLIRNRDFANRLLSVVVDEAHVVSHWGSGFRKKYGTLGILRALLPRSTPFVAMSATLAPRVRDDVLKKLQYGDDYVDIPLGNDRENVSIVVRAMQHPMNTYRDLDFIIPDNLNSTQELKKVFIYADTLTVANDIEDRLYERCPEHLRYTGFIRPYSAGFSVEYRKEVMEKFRKGEVRILICTDAAGMGCNIPDIDIVVQWKLPATVSTFVQRAGRAARGHGRKGLAILLVEKSVYEADLVKHMESAQDESSKSHGRKSRGVRQTTSYPKATKEYAIQRGVLRGGYDETKDSSGDRKDIPLDHLAIDEGLYTFVQTGGCRRRVLTLIYRNKNPNPTVPCCDNCAPDLLDETRPSEVIPIKRSAGVKAGVPNLSVMKSLNAWRVRVAKKDFSSAFFTANGFFSNDLVKLCASVGPIEDIERLRLVLGGKWSWIETYGEDLLNELTLLDVPPMQPKPTAASKRAAAAAEKARAPSDQDVASNAEDQTRVDEPSRPYQGPASTSAPSSSNNLPTHINCSTDGQSPANEAVGAATGMKRGAGAGERGDRQEDEGRTAKKQKKAAPTTISAHIDVTNMGAYGRAATTQPAVPAAPSQVHNPYMNSMVLGIGAATGATTAPPAPPQPLYHQPMWYPGYGWWPHPPPVYQPHPAYHNQASGTASYQQMANANTAWPQAPASASYHQPQPRPPT